MVGCPSKTAREIYQRRKKRDRAESGGRSQTGQREGVGGRRERSAAGRGTDSGREKVRKGEQGGAVTNADAERSGRSQR